MAKRSDAIFAANMPRRKNRRIGAILSGSGLVIFLLAALLVMPHAMGALPQRLLALLSAAWAWLTWWLATYEVESPEELLYRLRRVQSSDFGKQLLKNRPKRRLLKLPGVGEVALVSLFGPVVFLVMGAWWLSPLAPIRVRTLKIEDLTIPLGEQIIAASLVMPNGYSAIIAMPAVPQRARQIAELISDSADKYALGTKAIAQGRFADARTLLTEAADDGRFDAVRVALARGQNEIYAGKFAAAMPFLENALAKSPDNPTILCQMAVAWIHQGQFTQAEPLVAQAVKLADKGAAAAGALHLQAFLPVALGKDFNKAQEMCHAARTKLAEAGEDEQQNLIAPASLNNQAVLYVLCGKYYGGAELFKSAQDSWRQLSGEKHPDMAMVLSNRAALDACLARYEDAKKRYDQALTICKEGGSSQPLRHAAALCGLAGVNVTLADFDAARKTAEEARALTEKELGVEHRMQAAVHDLLGELSAGEGQYNIADSHYLRAQTFAKQAWGPMHPFNAAILNHQTLLYINQGRYQEVGTLIKQVLDICNLAKATDRAETAAALYHRSLASIRQDQTRGTVRSDLDKALSIQRDIYGEKDAEGVRAGSEEHPEIARTLGCLAALDNSPQTYGGGVSLFGKAIAMAERFLGPDNPTTAELLLAEAKLHMLRDKTAEAEECLNRALEIEKKRLPAAHPLITETLDASAALCDMLDPPQSKRAEKLRGEAKLLREKHAETDQPQ